MYPSPAKFWTTERLSKWLMFSPKTYVSNVHLATFRLSAGISGESRRLAETDERNCRDQVCADWGAILDSHYDLYQVSRLAMEKAGDRLEARVHFLANLTSDIDIAKFLTLISFYATALARIWKCYPASGKLLSDYVPKQSDNYLSANASLHVLYFQPSFLHHPLPFFYLTGLIRQAVVLARSGLLDDALELIRAQADPILQRDGQTPEAWYQCVLATRALWCMPMPSQKLRTAESSHCFENATFFPIPQRGLLQRAGEPRPEGFWRNNMYWTYFLYLLKIGMKLGLQDTLPAKCWTQSGHYGPMSYFGVPRIYAHVDATTSTEWSYGYATESKQKPQQDRRKALRSTYRKLYHAR